MRRTLAIALVVLFWLPPVFALLPGAQEFTLPACCRRHGIHHCAMAMAMAGETGPGHFFAATHHCPFYRNAPRATVPAFVSPASPIAHLVPETRASFIVLNTIALDAAYETSGRGPPSLC